MVGVRLTAHALASRAGKKEMRGDQEASREGKARESASVVVGRDEPLPVLTLVVAVSLT
jgi:hypothetical protein